jgi:hypothetical protein
MAAKYATSSGKNLQTIRVSASFRKAYGRSSAGLKWLIQGGVHDLARGIERAPETFKRKYDRLASDSSVLEVPISGQHRLLATYQAGRLDVLAVGDHDIVPQFSQTVRKANRVEGFTSAPRDFWPIEGRADSLFLSDPDLTLEKYGPEFDPEWAYFLSPEQTAAADHIFLAYEKLRPAVPALFVIIGGPGTGKTSILLKLLTDFDEFRELLGIRRIQFQCSDRLAAYTDACLPALRIQSYRANSYPPASVLLMDDPPDLRTINQAFMAASGVTGHRMVVIAIDPQQLDATISDKAFDDLVARAKAQRVELHSCYRQKAKVGRAARAAAQVIARSTPFLDTRKVKLFHQEHQSLTRLANSLSFPNPRGYVETYAQAQRRNLSYELERISKYPAWQHWPGVLAFLDYGVKLPSSWMKMLEGARAEIVERDRIASIKGLEYQHVLLFLDGETFVRIHEGFTGTGRTVYAWARLLRIPYSRAKDSLVTFVMSSQ